MANLMERIREALGMRPASSPQMTDEQARVRDRLDRIARRQKAIDIQVDVLRADTHDMRTRE